MLQSKDMHVLYIPAWLPTSDNQFGGSFILDQAHAVQKHTPTDIGFIFRQNLSITGRHTVIRSYLDSFDHVVVTKPYIPKVTTYAISLWCNQYYDAFKRYVKHHGTPDIIHAHSYVAGFAARYIHAKSNIPFVLTEHLTSFLDQTIKHPHISSLKKVLDEAAAIIAVSRKLREAMGTYSKKNIHVIPNLFDKQVFTPARNSRNDHYTIVAIGDLIPRKAFDVLIAAFKIALDQGPDLRLEIIGTGPLSKQLGSQVREMHLQSRVTFHGPCKPREVAEVLQASDLCVSTSHVETFGITLIEAMACGVPVVATPSGGPQEIVTAHTGIITSNMDPNTIAAAILEIKRNKDKYRPADLREYALKKYERQVVANQIIELYRRVLRK